MKKHLFISAAIFLLIPCPAFSQKNKPEIQTVETDRYYGPTSERERIIEDIRWKSFRINDSLKEYFEYKLGKNNRKTLLTKESYNPAGFITECGEYKKNKTFNHYKFIYHCPSCNGNIYLLDTLEGKKLRTSDTIFVKLIRDKQDSMRLTYIRNKTPRLDQSDFSEVFKAPMEYPIEREEEMDSLRVRMLKNDNGKSYYIVKREARGDWLNLQYVGMQWPYPDICIETRNDKKNYREIFRYDSEQDEKGGLTGYHLYMKYFYYTLEDGCKVTEEQYYTDWDDEKHYSKPLRTIKAFKCNEYDEYMEIKGVGKIIEHSMTEKKYYK